MFKFDERIELKMGINDVLAVGELLIDMISSDYDDNFASCTYNKYFGGSPANIAMNAKKLGISSIIASAVGDDGLGKFLINHIRDVGLSTKYIQEVGCSTSMVVLTKSKNNPVPIFYRDADYHLDYTPGLKKAVKESRIVHFSSWPISRMPARHTIEKLINEAKRNGSLICFDPNYHPRFWQNGEDGVEYVKSVISSADIVKPSEADAERLFGKDKDEEQLKKFLSLGVKLVIMTLGEEGAIVSNGDKTIKFDTMATDVVDTTGAGDAFWSGFYAGIVKGYTLRKALLFGFAVSAFKLKYTGAVVNLPKPEEIEKLYGLK